MDRAVGLYGVCGLVRRGIEWHSVSVRPAHSQAYPLSVDWFVLTACQLSVENIALLLSKLCVLWCPVLTVSVQVFVKYS